MASPVPPMACLEGAPGMRWDAMGWYPATLAPSPPQPPNPPKLSLNSLPQDLMFFCCHERSRTALPSQARRPGAAAGGAGPDWGLNLGFSRQSWRGGLWIGQDFGRIRTDLGASKWQKLKHHQCMIVYCRISLKPCTFHQQNWGCVRSSFNMSGLRDSLALGLKVKVAPTRAGTRRFSCFWFSSRPWSWQLLGAMRGNQQGPIGMVKPESRKAGKPQDKNVETSNPKQGLPWVSRRWMP